MLGKTTTLPSDIESNHATDVVQGTGHVLNKVAQGWLDDARRALVVILGQHFGAAPEEAIDAVEYAATRVTKFMRFGRGYPYPSSVLMHMSRLAHEWLNRSASKMRG